MPASVTLKPEPSSRTIRSASPDLPGLDGTAGASSCQVTQPARARWKMRWTPWASTSTNFPWRETPPTYSPASASSGIRNVFSAAKDTR